MSTIYACRRCRSTSLWRDAAEDINSGEYVTYDNVSCGICSYDGHRYLKFEVAYDFEIPDDDRMPDEIAGEETYL